MCPQTIHVSCIPGQIYIHQSVTSVLVFLLSATFKVLCRRQRWWAVRVIPAHNFDGQKYWPRVQYFLYMLMLFSTRPSFIAFKDMWPVTPKAHHGLNFIYMCIYTYIYFPPNKNSVYKATLCIIYNNLMHAAAPANAQQSIENFCFFHFWWMLLLLLLCFIRLTMDGQHLFA